MQPTAPTRTPEVEKAMPHGGHPCSALHVRVFRLSNESYIIIIFVTVVVVQWLLEYNGCYENIGQCKIDSRLSCPLRRARLYIKNSTNYVL